MNAVAVVVNATKGSLAKEARAARPLAADADRLAAELVLQYLMLLGCDQEHASLLALLKASLKGLHALACSRRLAESLAHSRSVS